MVDKFLEWTKKNGWLTEQVDSPLSLPDAVVSRYKSIPEEWFDFIGTFTRITNSEDNMWFLTCYDYQDSYDDFEKMSLEAASGDEAWTNDIKAFWDKTFTIIMSVRGDYHYFAIDLESGKVIEGWEPEFEKVTVVAESFNDFLSKIFTGEISLII